MNIWSRLRQSFWFLPTLLCAGAVVVAETLVIVDRHLGDSSLTGLDPLITRVGEAGSRDLLGAIAASMLAVASTTFSITIAVLAVSSSTYGPRLVRNFMADRSNQFVLGIFVATFLYSLLVLRSIRDVGADGGAYFVPHLAVNVAVLLAVLSLGVLVYFIHHISESVQVWTLTEQVGVDLLQAVQRVCPESTEPTVHDHPRPSVDPEHIRSQAADITASETGYVQSIDHQALVSLATKHDLVISVQVRPGQHVVEGIELALLQPPERVSEDARRRAKRAFRVGRAREPLEDIEFSALLLEEMAVRALSPGTNDPYTAINALDNLAGGLVAMARRPAPLSCHHDPNGALRVIAPAVGLTDIVGHLADALRHYAAGHPTVVRRGLDLIAQVGENCSSETAREELATHARRLVEAFVSTAPEAGDLQAILDHGLRVHEQLLPSRS